MRSAAGRARRRCSRSTRTRRCCSDHGATEITAFEKVYAHTLEGSYALAEWVSGTALVPYFERLPDGLSDAFMTRYRARLRERWPAGPVFYPFRRTLFAATVPK